MKFVLNAAALAIVMAAAILAGLAAALHQIDLR